MQRTLIRYSCKYTFGRDNETRITVAENIFLLVFEEKSYEEELVQDVLSVIRSSSKKLYGTRSHKSKAIVNGVKKLFEEDGYNHGN